MAMSVVRCPFCERRYNVTGIPAGTKVLCTSCRAILTVPPSRRRPRASLWSRWIPRHSGLQVAVGLVGGFVLAAALYGVFRSQGSSEAPGSPVRPAEVAAGETAPDRGGLPPPTTVAKLSRDEQRRRFTEGIYKEFGPNTFEFDVRPPSCFVLAGERSPEQMVLAPMFEEFQWALVSLREKFAEEFGHRLELGGIDELLKVVIFTRRETFDECLRRGNNAPLPSEVPGIYQYVKRRTEFYYDRNAYPIEVLLHESVHQIVHYYYRQRADQGATQSWWFQEGIATYFEPYARSQTGRVVVDPGQTGSRMAAVREALKTGDLPPLYQLMGLDIHDIWELFKVAPTVEEQERRMRAANRSYAAAWAFTHFLRHAHGGRYRPLYDEYFRRELEGRGGKDVFTRLLSERYEGRELGDLQIELEAYLRGLSAK